MKRLPIIRGLYDAQYQVGRFDSKEILPCNQKLWKNYSDEIASLPELSRDQKIEVASMIIGGSEHQRSEIASARLMRIRVNILENLFGADFFEVVELAHDEIPFIYIERDQRWAVSQIGMHGGAPFDAFVNGDTIQQFVPYPLSSDIATYPLSSPIIGRFENLAERVNARVAFDWDRKMDIDFRALMTLNFEGAFANPDMVYDLDPRIQNYPSGNFLDLSAEGAFNLTVFKAIFQHFENMGENGPAVSTIYIPSTALSEIWSIGQVVSAFSGGPVQPGQTISEGLQDEILRRGRLGNLFGHTFRMRAMNTLADGECLVSTDRPMGTLFVKRDLDRVRLYREEDLELANGTTNHEGVRITRHVVPVCPSPWKLNALKVQYK